MPKARAHLIIKGRVQGVYYRAFTEETARTFGLSGWVRNLHDGSVEALFEGERDAIERAMEACRKGPPAARVADMEIEWEDYRGEHEGFSVRYY